MNEMMGGFMERPKHAMGGVASGLKCVAGGALAGVVGLVAMPVIGAKENGVKGFAAGVGKGVAYSSKSEFDNETADAIASDAITVTWSGAPEGNGKQ